MITNADITIYNKYFDKEEKCTKYKRTYIQGVNYRISDGVSSLSTQKGASNNNEIIIYIPFSVYSESKTYLRPKAYEALSDTERDCYYTLNAGDIIIRGIIDFELTGEQGSNLKVLSENYDDISTVSNVITYDFGSDNLKHWKVVCK